jgi:hypothetical protein
MRVRLICHQRIHFHVGDPKVVFTIKEKKEAPPADRASLPREPRAEKPPKATKPSITISERSLSGCYGLIQTLKERRSLRELFALRNSQLDKTHRYSEQAPDMLDLGGIEARLRNGQYEAVADFTCDLEDFFDSVREVFGPTSDFGQATQRFITEIRRAMADVPQPEPVVRLADLQTQLREFAALDAGDVGEAPLEISAAEIAQRLNRLNGKDRFKAEWLIRMHCPTLPYYAAGVDIAQLPFPEIESVLALLNGGM